MASNLVPFCAINQSGRRCAPGYNDAALSYPNLNFIEEYFCCFRGNVVLNGKVIAKTFAIEQAGKVGLIVHAQVMHGYYLHGCGFR